MPDPKTGSPRLVPVVVHKVQPVVAVPSARRVRRVVAGTPNDPNRKTVQTAICERLVPPAEILVRDLLVGFLGSAAVSRVDAHVAVVQVVLVTSRQDDGVRALARASRDTGLAVSMHASLRQLGARFEAAPQRISWYVTEDRARHEVILLIVA